MIGELDIDGLYLSPALVSGVLAFVLFVVARRMMVRAGVYRVVWHVALFDAALFVILWAAVAALPLPTWS